MLEAVRVASLDTEVSVIDLGKGCSANSGDAVVGDLDLKPATDAAVAACGLYDVIGWTRANAVNVRNRARWTVVHARPARYAGAIRKLLGRTEDKVR